MPQDIHDSRPNENPNSRKNRIRELTAILTAGYLRRRQRLARKWAEENLEKVLDDVPPSGKLRTTENRTLEKGAGLK